MQRCEFLFLITSSKFKLIKFVRTLHALEYSPSHGASACSSFKSVSSSSVCPASSAAFNCRASEPLMIAASLEALAFDFFFGAISKVLLHFTKFINEWQWK